MALSQVQCLDDNHVNPRVTESKPDFLYSEGQRLALEALLRDGREAFFKCLEARGLRGFLSELELEVLAAALEPYDPGTELFPTNAQGEDEAPALSLHYWPSLSDTSTPEMDLGWPDSEAYRGVTRTTVYSQPPMEGQTHVKEVIRKMIAAAQKVIAVVMDIFTDVDIFRDLLDAGFKRKISVYILLERSTLPHFLSMCQRANMHPGHLKYLRVRCLGGEEFHTRSSTKVKGRSGHRFMFIDGDKAMSGTYSFTWMSSRLDRNLITVTTGQAVTAFDTLFRTLFVTSSPVDLLQVATDPEPEPERLPQVAPVTLPSAAVARKLHNPKYALVSFGLPSQSPSSSNVSPKEDQNPDTPDAKKRRRAKPSREAEQEGPPLHPGLVNLEKACLMSYLPTWPEPDPPSDVIGFINVIDASKQNHFHLQRSEIAESTKAIRFSSPFTKPEESLPEVAKPRQMTVKREEVEKVQPAQDKTKADKLIAEKAQTAQLKSGSGNPKDKTDPSNQNVSGLKGDTAKTLNTQDKLNSNKATHNVGAHNSTSRLSATPAQLQASTPTVTPTLLSHTDATKTQNTQDKLHSNKTTSKDEAHNSTTRLSANPTQLPSGQASTPNISNSPRPNSPHGPTPQRDAETSVETKGCVYRSHSPQSNTKQTSHLQGPTDSATEKDTLKTHSDSKTDPAPSATSATSLPKTNHVSITTSTPTNTSSTSSSSSNPPPNSSSKTDSPPLSSPPASSSLTPNPTPPVPKPRTIQLVVKDCLIDGGQEIQAISVVKRSDKSPETLEVHNGPVEAPVEETTTKKEPETTTELIHNSRSQTEAGKDAKNETPQQKQCRNLCETKNEEVDQLTDSKTGMQSDAAINLEAYSDVFIDNAPQSESGNLQETRKIMPTEELNPVIEVKVPEIDLPKVSENVKPNKIYHARPHQPQRISYGELTTQDMAVLETVNSMQTSAAEKQGLELANCTNSMPDTEKHNTHSASQELISKAKENPPEKSLHLNLSDAPAPDPRTPTPEREIWSLAALARTPTPDGCPSRTSTPDYRTPTPDSRSYTPDGYITPKEDSDEYYDCDSPLSEPGVDRAAHCNQGTTEDQVSLTSSPSPTYKSYITRTKLGPADRTSPSSETKSGATRVLSPISLLERKVGEEEGNVREESETVRVEDRDGTEEAQRPAEHVSPNNDSTEVVEKNEEAQPQAPKRKRVIDQSGARRLSDGGSTNEGAEEKRVPTGDLKPKMASDNEKTGYHVALGPSGVEKRDRPLSFREHEGQKVLHTPPRPPRGQQETATSSNSRPSRPLRPTSGIQPPGTRQSGSSPLNQADSKVLDVSDYASSPRRGPSRPPPPASGGAVASASGRKQTEVSQSLQSLLSRQPQPGQGRARAGQLQNNNPLVKSQTSLLRTHASSEPLYSPRSQIQTVSSKEAQGEEDMRAPFTVTLGKLYGLKGLKDRMSKKGSSSSPVQGRKSTS